MFVHFDREVKVLLYTQLLAVFLNFRDGGLDVTVVPLIDFQSFFLGSFRSVGPVAFGRFLYAIDIGVLAAAYPNLLEVIPALVVVQGIHGEYLLFLNLCQSEDGTDGIVSVLELRLVEEDFYVRVVDNGLLDDGAVDDIVEFLRHHSCYAVELSHRLIEVFDVFRHSR